MTSALEYHHQTIGRILAHLVSHGLGRVDYGEDDAIEITTDRRGNEEEVQAAFHDCLLWMMNEGLIRVDSHAEYQGGYHFIGTQLTATGIALVRAKDDAIGSSIEREVAAKGGKLDPATYTKFGEFAGSFIGSLTKSLAGG